MKLHPRLIPLIREACKFMSSRDEVEAFCVVLLTKRKRSIEIVRIDGDEFMILDGKRVKL
jgi:hypothetical protein